MNGINDITNDPLNLIVMLTQYDHTVPDAQEIFEQCKNSRALYWGFKEEPLPLEQMQALFSHMKQCGKITVLEVVAYTEEQGLRGAQMAASCGCDILMGTQFFPSVNQFCQEHNLKYMPYVGSVQGRPSVLSGSVQDMIQQTKAYLAQGAFGVNLLAYRYSGDAAALIDQFMAQVDAPVCIAGSVNSYERLDLLKKAKPWGFTIGGAFFEHRFGQDLCQQINHICHYVAQEDTGC